MNLSKQKRPYIWQFMEAKEISFLTASKLRANFRNSGASYNEILTIEMS